MKRPIAVLVSIMLLLAFASSDVLAKKGNKQREVTLHDYAGTIHWNEFDKAAEFLDPEWRMAHPLSALDMARYKQIQITGYDVRSSSIGPDGSYDQVVEIRLINVNTQVERALTDHQHWRWDPTVKHWWLASGLPDITATDEP